MRYLRSVIGVGISLLAVSCGPMNKVLKTGDSEQIYQQGLKDYYAKKYRNSVVYFMTVMNDYYGTDRYDTLVFYSGKGLYQMGDYLTAADYMDTYRKEFPRRNFTEEAEFLLPMSYYRASRPAERDQTETHQAITAFNDYLNRYPQSIRANDIKAIMTELENKLYEKEFLNASLYVKLERYPAAVTALRNTLKESPETPYREEIMYLISKSWYNYARNSIPSRKLDRYMKMVDSYYNFMNEYPDSPAYSKELNRMFEEAQFYISRNQQATIDIQRSQIEIDTRKLIIRQQQADVRSIADPIERASARARLKQEKADLKTQEKIIKREARELKRATSRKSLDRQAQEDVLEREAELLAK